jgi:hypothetical protein
VFHDFHDWQKSSTEIKHIRAIKRQAGHLGGLAKAKADALARAKADARRDSQHDAKGLLENSLAAATADALADLKSCYTQPATSNQHYRKNLGEKEKSVVGGKTIRRGVATLTDAGAPPTGTEGRPPRLVTPNVSEIFLSFQASDTSEDEPPNKAATLAAYQAYLERNGLTPGPERPS